MPRRKERARAWVRASSKNKDRPKSKHRWEVVYEDPNDNFRRRTKGGFLSKTAAEEWRDGDESPARRKRGEWVDPARGDVTFHDVAVEWLEAYVPRNGKTRGKEEHAKNINGKRSLLRTTFADTRIGDITPAMVGRWINKMDGMGRSASTIRHYFYTLRLVLRFAVGEGLIPADPTAKIDTPKPRDLAAEEADRYALSRDQVNRLIAAVPEPWDMYLLLLARTGMRPEEVAGLYLYDLDEDCTTIRVRRVLVRSKAARTDDNPNGLILEKALKTKRSRRDLRLDRDSAARLRAYVKVHKQRAAAWFDAHPEHTAPEPTDLPLFVGVDKFRRGAKQRKSGTDLDWLDYMRPMDHGWFHMRHWAQACRAAGIPASERVVPYDLRHFHCSELIRQIGKPGALTITQVSARMGHASTHMTLTRYNHLLPKNDDQMDAALDAVFADEKPAHLRAV